MRGREGGSGREWERSRRLDKREKKGEVGRTNMTLFGGISNVTLGHVASSKSCVVTTA